MTRPLLFIRVDMPWVAYARVKLPAEPVVGSLIWIAGTRYVVEKVVCDDVWIKRPPRGYRDPTKRKQREAAEEDK